MGQENLLPVVQAFRVSKSLIDEDQSRLSRLERAFAGSAKAGKSAIEKTAMIAATNAGLAVSKQDFKVRYPTSGGWKQHPQAVKAPTLRGTGIDLLKNWAKGTVREALKKEGGAFYYVAWAWQGADAVKSLLKPGHPAIKVIEVGLFLNKVVLEIQRKYLDARSAEFAKHIDWVLKAHTDAADRLMADAHSLVKEANAASGKVVPKWVHSQGLQAKLLKAVNRGRPGDSEKGKHFVRSMLQENMLDDLAYLHDLRAGVYSLGASVEALSLHCQSLVDYPHNRVLLPKELRQYQGYVHPNRNAILAMFAKDLSGVAAQARAALQSLESTEFNLWSVIGRSLER
ncbi:MAG: hypothetical protein HY000_18255 [Planctomycetes bacterium]|nr:hypothetical protein [Planctomycetota bacterium]